MFKLIALIFVLGVAGGPVATMQYRDLFQTKDACVAFLASDAGALAKRAVVEMLAADENHLRPEFQCVEAPDNSI